MDRLHVYVGSMPRMTRDITTRALREHGYAVLDAPSDPAALRSPAPILIVSRLGVYERRLFAALPQAVVIAFEDDGRRITRYELWPRAFALGELSADAVEAAVRTPSPWDERFRG